MSLDPPISSLADAAFELLWMQHWFDAILLIDDTAASDLFSYRLNRLCRNNRSKKYKSTNSPSSSSSSSPLNSPETLIPPYEHQHYHSRSTNSQQFDNNFYFLDSVWNRLEVIQLSKNLLQNEVSINTPPMRFTMIKEYKTLSKENVKFYTEIIIFTY